jgi:hypothetical protein
MLAAIEISVRTGLTMTEQGRSGSGREQLPQDSEFERTKLFVEFAKFGFYGTLSFAIVGAVLIFGLACLSAWTSFKMDASLVVMAAIIAVGSVAFGFLSLWQAPSIAAKWGKDYEIAISAATRERTKDSGG